MDGKQQDGSPLEGAAVRLLDGPVYELRNQIVGDGANRIVPAISPAGWLKAFGEEGMQRSNMRTARNCPPS
ncbi:MAG TPA: hypothetical protein VLV83_07045 [Acidobacteriota bacterium]|nr:hypothetical protein [Acidobacteriota bacterium]